MGCDAKERPATTDVGCPKHVSRDFPSKKSKKRLLLKEWKERNKTEIL